jgi:hypothetical protein
MAESWHLAGAASRAAFLNQKIVLPGLDPGIHGPRELSVDRVERWIAGSEPGDDENKRSH